MFLFSSVFWLESPLQSYDFRLRFLGQWLALDWLLIQLSWEAFAFAGWEILSWAESLSVLGQLLYITVQLFGTHGKMISEKRDFCVKLTCSYGLFLEILFYKMFYAQYVFI
jgi:hypothetical protein